MNPKSMSAPKIISRPGLKRMSLDLDRLATLRNNVNMPLAVQVPVSSAWGLEL